MTVRYVGMGRQHLTTLGCQYLPYTTFVYIIAALEKPPLVLYYEVFNI